jgi:hypothetical protein
MNHIVIPLPSGVSNAPIMIKKITMHPILFFQKARSTRPDLVMAHMMIGI